MSKAWRSRWHILLGLAMAAALCTAWVIITFGPAPVTLALAMLSLALFALGPLYARDMRRESEQRKLLVGIAQDLSSKLDLGSLFDAIVHAILRAVPLADKCVIHLLDESGRRLYPRYSSESDLAQALGMPLGKGIAGQALLERRTRIIPNVREDPGFLPLESSSELRSLMVAPLHVEGKLLGTISLNSKMTNAFSQADESLVTMLAAQASTALYQTQLYEEARRETQYVEAIINNLSDGLVLLDAEGRVLRYNPSLAHILGADVEETLGHQVEATSEYASLRRLAMLLGDEAERESDSEFGYERQVEIDEPLHAVLRVRVAPARVRLASASGKSGQVARIVTIHDETEALDRIHVGQNLMSAVSTDLRASLDRIRGYTTLVRSSPLAEAASASEGWMARIQEESDRLWRLGQDLDDLHAWLTGTLAFEDEALSLQELLRELRDDVAPEAAHQEVTVEVRYPPSLPEVHMDGARLYRLLRNLMDDALGRASEGGRILLDAQANLEEVSFTLTDDGAPVPPEARQRLLAGDLFRPGETSSAVDGNEGSGLPLYIGFRLAQAQGGHLWAQASADGLTQWRLILPLA